MRAEPAPDLIIDGGIVTELREERITETLRRSQGAVADARRLLNEIVRAVRAGRTFVDYRSVHEGPDFVIPHGIEFDAVTDNLDPNWLRGDARRWYKVAEAVATRIEFFETTLTDDAVRNFTMRLHLI